MYRTGNLLDSTVMKKKKAQFQYLACALCISAFLFSQGETLVRLHSQLKMGLLDQTDLSRFAIIQRRCNLKCSESTNKQLTLYRFVICNLFVTEEIIRRHGNLLHFRKISKFMTETAKIFHKSLGVFVITSECHRPNTSKRGVWINLVT